MNALTKTLPRLINSQELRNLNKNKMLMLTWERSVTWEMWTDMRWDKPKTIKSTQSWQRKLTILTQAKRTKVVQLTTWSPPNTSRIWEEPNCRDKMKMLQSEINTVQRTFKRKVTVASTFWLAKICREFKCPKGTIRFWATQHKPSSLALADPNVPCEI